MVTYAGAGRFNTCLSSRIEDGDGRLGGNDYDVLPMVNDDLCLFIEKNYSKSKGR